MTSLSLIHIYYSFALALVAGIVAVAIVIVIRFSPERRGEIMSVAH